MLEPLCKHIAHSVCPISDTDTENMQIKTLTQGYPSVNTQD